MVSGLYHLVDVDPHSSRSLLVTGMIRNNIGGNLDALLQLECLVVEHR